MDPNPVPNSTLPLPSEEDVRAMQARYKLIVENATEGIWTIDAHNHTTFVNARGAQILGYTPAEILGRSPIEFLFPEDRPSGETDLAAMARGAAIEREYRVRRKDRSVCWVRSSTQPLYDPSGNYVGALGMFQDISDRKRAEEALRRLNADLERRVAERTAELERTNEELTCEIEERKTAEEALRQSEQQANDLIRHAPTAIYQIDFRGPRFISVNDAMCQMSGYTREELLAMSPFALLDERSRQLFGERMQKTFAGEPIDSSVAYRAIVKDGREVYTVLQTRLTYQDGKPIGAFVIAHDVTERKRMADVLRAELNYTKRLQDVSSRLIRGANIDDLYRQILDAAIALMDSDMASVQMYDPEHDDLMLLAWKGFHPDSAAFWQSVRADSTTTCGRALHENNRVIVEDVDTCDWLAGTADFEQYHLSGIRAMQSTPLIARDGRTLGMLSTHWRAPHVPGDRELVLIDVLARQAADLIERTQREDALRQRTDELQAIMEAVPTAVFIARDSAARNIIGNRAARELLAAPPSANLSKSAPEDERPTAWQEMRNGVPIPPEELPLQQAARGSEVRGYEMDLLFRDGSVKSVIANATPLRDEKGSPQGGVAVLEDVTERKRAEEEHARLHGELERRATELEMAYRELESFTYSVSHDLRTPLATIDSLAQALLQDYGSHQPELQNHLGLIRVGTAQMKDLIESLLNLSRLTRHTIHRETVNMTVLVTQALETIHREPSRQNLTIDFKSMREAQADPVLIKQVWVNLIGNALKFTRKREAARIEIGCGPADGEDCAYYVRDNGVGFDMEQADRLFGVFQRLHNEEEYEGTGVGLAIVQRIIHRHGGRVWAEAEEGNGATFYFTLA